MLGKRDQVAREVQRAAQGIVAQHTPVRYTSIFVTQYGKVNYTILGKRDQAALLVQCAAQGIVVQHSPIRSKRECDSYFLTVYDDSRRDLTCKKGEYDSTC